jgi:hypothetical protein
MFRVITISEQRTSYNITYFTIMYCGKVFEASATHTMNIYHSRKLIVFQKALNTAAYRSLHNY